MEAGRVQLHGFRHQPNLASNYNRCFGWYQRTGGIGVMGELVIQDSKVVGIGKMCGVYRFLNTLDGKCYIGSTINMRERWLDHIAELNGQKHANKYLMA